MLIYLMALDTEEERIKFVRLYEEYRNRMHYTASILLKSEIERMEINYTFYLFALLKKAIKKLLTFCY